MTGATVRVAYPPEIVAAMGAAPTLEQWQAISMPLEPYVIVAGAGSGKTSVIAARVVYLALVALGRIEAAHPGVLPGNVLCLTFTNKATENLMLRVRRALSAGELAEGEEPTVLNYHGFAAQVIERYGLLAGIESGRRVLTGAQRSELCARVLDDPSVSFEQLTVEWQPTVVDKILTLADQMANHRRTADEVIAFNEGRLPSLGHHRSEKARQAACERIELARAVKRFQELKESLGVIDFGDQITLALDVVERFPRVIADYRGRYHAVVLDEYQDTNVAQAALLRAVFGDGFPVAAVGDPDQNIYAWRGASLFNLLQFGQEFPKPDGSAATKLPLYTNFRSGATILEAADRIIAPLPAAQRPDPDKKLVPWPDRGKGEVVLRRLGDEWTEASWIADRILELREGPDGPRWSDFAVLCRKSRLFVPMERAFADRRIPVEIVGLAGLLKLPEVVETLAYARATADPFAATSFARILLGPRYRVGFKDLARVAAWAKDRNYRLRDEDDDETAPFLFAEAFEHLDEVTFVSDEGRARLEEFRAELASLRAEAGRPVGEFLAGIVRRIGLLGELDASGDEAFARSVKRNLAAVLDEVHAFAPLEGELTLRAFLDYVDAVEASDRSEWSPIQPSEEDSVKVMTIHQAKGLEFDTVFVPGLAKWILPDARVQHNPAEKGKSLDFELRGDAGILPAFDGVLSHFYWDLRAQAEIEERRACYVALTRARNRLFVTGAHWYGDGDSVKEPSAFFEELADWGEEVPGRASVDRGPDPAESNPLAEYRERFVRDWPGPATRAEPDALFPAGSRRAAADASREDGVQPSLVEALSAEDREAYEREAEGNRTLAAHLVRRETGRREPGHALPATVAVGGLVDYALCPKRFYWSAVRPLPRFSGPAARVGSQIHAWIERRSSGQASLLELDQAPDLTAEDLSGEPGRVERLQRAFEESRFAGEVPLFAERPFLLHVDGFVVSGRIDAIFGTPDGPWEVVDYKTGRVPDRDDPVAGLQLDLYALACVDVWRKAPADLTLTYLYLGSGEEVSRPAGDLEAVRARVAGSLAAMGREQFEPTPGPQCRWCDFLSFCDAGQAHLS